MKKILICLSFLFLILAPFTAKATILTTMCFSAPSNASSNSACTVCNYSVQWSACVDGKQYSSFVKTSECSGGIVPPAEKDCSTPWPPVSTPKPPTLPFCQESNFTYGDWTPCVNNVSIRIAIKKGSCDGGFVPETRIECSASRPSSMPACQESSFYYSDWSPCNNSVSMRSAFKNEECVDGFAPITWKNCAAPRPVLACQESDFDYGEWGACVNNVSSRSVSKKEACVGGFVPTAWKNCEPLVCQESSFSYSGWTPCANNVSQRFAFKKEECSGGFSPTTQKGCQSPQPAAARQESDSDYSVSATSTIITKSALRVYAVSDNNNLNIRQTKSVTAKIVGTMKKKTKYEVVDSSDKTWIQIKFNNKTGWVLRRLVKL